MSERTVATPAQTKLTRSSAEEHAASGEAWRGQARGLDYAEGAALLAPVQTKEGDPTGPNASDAEPAPVIVSRKSFGHWLQSSLNLIDQEVGLLDKPLVVDGIVGPLTKGGTKAFQARVQEINAQEPAIPPSGVVGPDTIGALERAHGEKNPTGRPASPLPPPAAAADAQVDGAPAADATPTTDAEPEVAAAPGPATEAEADTGGEPAGDQLETVLPLPPEQEAALATAHQPDAGAKGGGDKTPSAGTDADLKARLEQARAELGKVRERAYKGVPKLMSARHAKKLLAAIKRKHPGKKPNEVTIWYAADQHSLDRLEAYAKTVGLGYSAFIAANAAGYAWCGSFVAQHLQLNASFTFVNRKKKTATVRAGVALASTLKSDAFFNYKSIWNGAWIEDPTAPADAPVADRYKPLRAFHAANGGERQWHPVGAWKDDPSAVAKPGMVLFVKGTAAYGDHMIFVDTVEADGQGGWVVHTVEGNAPGARTKAHKYTISAKGKTEIKAVARPAPLDFDGDVRMVDKATYMKLLKDEK